MFRTPSQSFYSRGSGQKTPERITKVQGSSGVKMTPICKSVNRFKTDVEDTIQRGTRDYVHDLEAKIAHLEETERTLVSQLQLARDNSKIQEVLERRVLQLLNENHNLNLKLATHEQVLAENESLKQLVYEQQYRIMQYNAQKKQTGKHLSFGDYFKEQ